MDFVVLPPRYNRVMLRFHLCACLAVTFISVAIPSMAVPADATAVRAAVANAMAGRPGTAIVVNVDAGTMLGNIIRSSPPDALHIPDQA